MISFIAIKVKLTPGSLKKGKAAKQAVEFLSRVGGGEAREVQLMKTVPSPDMMNVMLSSVKISMPGLQKIQIEAKRKPSRGKR